MRLRAVILTCATLMAASAALGTSFVVPTDAELVAKSAAIVIGTVEGSFVQERDGTIETVYEIRAERALKSSVARGELIRVMSYGGVIGDRGLWVPASAHFRHGDRVLLFLTRDGDAWRTTDMTLGKFRFAQSTAGERLLVRDMEDVIGWDHAGQEHEEKVRRESGFLRFIEERVSGRPTLQTQGYQVQASSVTLQTDAERFTAITNAPFPAATYTDHISNMPIRWPNISAGVTFWKRTDQNISGAADGGVSTIQNGLAAWTNECGSNINLVYGGQRQTASANHDATNMVEFNDPQSRISGAWTGAGTIAITFLSFAGDHPYNSQTWITITDADVVFQNAYPATNAAFAAAMTHELGHALGWRHSNQNHLTGGACNSAVEECTTNAIMNSSVNANHGFTLQTWDINAAQSVYPGGTCGTPPPPPPPCTAPSITAQPQSRTITAGSSTTLSVTATGTGTLAYQWYQGASGNTSSPLNGATFSSITVSASSTTSYWVRVTNSCGSVNSATATVTVTAPAAPPTELRTDFNGDGKSDIFWRNPSTGANTIWLMNGSTVTGTVLQPVIGGGWTPQAFGDLNGDGRSDVFWRNPSTGDNVVWLMNANATPTQQTTSFASSGWDVVGSGDFSGEGRIDLFWRNSSTGANQVWFMNGATPTGVNVVATVSTAWHVGGIGDFDNNGRADVFWRNPSIAANVLWLTTSTGGTNEVGIQAVAGSWQIVGTGDFNGDGRADVFWRQDGTGYDVIWLMNGTTVTQVAMPTVALSWRPGVFGDFNEDGTHDVGWSNTSGSNAMWLINNTRVTTEIGLPAVGPGWVMYGTR